MLHGACVGDVDVPSQGAFGAFGAIGTTDECDVALQFCMLPVLAMSMGTTYEGTGGLHVLVLHACVGDVDGLTEGAFGADKLVDDAYGTTD